MKRIIFTVLMLTALLAMSTGIAFASSVLGMSVSNGGGGPTFTFTVSGDFSKLNGIVEVQGGDSFPLYCRQTDETTVVCHATKKITGENVVVTFGGSTFWASVPLPSIGQGSGNNTPSCYNVYGWNNDFFNNPTDWVLAGTNCQNTPASYGDTIEFPFANNFVPYNTYYFSNTGTISCGFSEYGDAYYYGLVRSC